MGAAGIAAMAAKHSVQVSSMLQSVADARTLTAADHDRIREAYSTFIMDTNSGETLNVRIVEALRSLVGNSRMPVEMIQGYVDSLHIPATAVKIEDVSPTYDYNEFENHAKIAVALFAMTQAVKGDDSTMRRASMTMGLNLGLDPMRLSMLLMS